MEVLPAHLAIARCFGGLILLLAQNDRQLSVAIVLAPCTRVGLSHAVIASDERRCLSRRRRLRRRRATSLYLAIVVVTLGVAPARFAARDGFVVAIAGLSGMVDGAWR